MSLHITESAKNELSRIMEGSGFKSPALRIVFSGVG